eukprot:SAG31_NODE_34321_length_334_cov_0.829787_1_plen_37_part_01
MRSEIVPTGARHSFSDRCLGANMQYIPQGYHVQLENA